MTPASTSPSILRRTARGAYDLLAFAALASAPAGAVYTYLQFQVSLTPNREQIDTARHAGDLRNRDDIPART